MSESNLTKIKEALKASTLEEYLQESIKNVLGQLRRLEGQKGVLLAELHKLKEIKKRVKGK